MEMILENQVSVMPNGAQNSQAPLVAVFMVTYNHSSFIARAIESVLSQNTTFNYQLFIGEDVSTDDTGELCRRYAEQFPDKVNLYCREKNIGVFENANLLFQSCLSSGAKYIAMLEGDDFWSDQNKLQKQIEILEGDESISATFHNTQIVFSDGQKKIFRERLKEVMYQSDLITKYAPFHTSSFVFRAKHYCRPEWFMNIDSIDLAMFVWHSQFGRFVGINQAMSAYRIHETSLTSSISHRDYFHDRRVILHRMMQGKILHQSFELYRQFIRFHEANSKGDWIRNMRRPIGFFFQENSIMRQEYQWLRMCLDAPILNFNISENGMLRSQDFKYKVYNRLYFFNHLIWRKLIGRMSEKLPSNLCFLDEVSFDRFKKYFGSTGINIFILFPFSTEKFNQEKMVYKNLFQVDWLSLKEIERMERLLKWNSEIRNGK